ncbi:MAG: hypothetical protein GXX85_12545 [Ignavibacteria bacterium]|nr:hypothetical protein [Ignavibacteria bacterium]
MKFIKKEADKLGIQQEFNGNKQKISETDEKVFDKLNLLKDYNSIELKENYFDSLIGRSLEKNRIKVKHYKYAIAGFSSLFIAALTVIYSLSDFKDYSKNYDMAYLNYYDEVVQQDEYNFAAISENSIIEKTYENIKITSAVDYYLNNAAFAEIEQIADDFQITLDIR